MRPRRPVSFAAIAAACFGVVSLAHLVIVGLGLGDPVQRVSQALLMPTLLAWALAPLPGAGTLPARISGPIALALLCSFAGDLAPGFLEGDAGFLGMVGAFFLAQVAWVVALWPWRADSILRPGARPLVLAYAGLAAAVLALTAQGAGPLIWAIVPYAAVVSLTGVLATGLGWRGTIGGLLFIASDAMIAVFSFAPLLRPSDVVRGLVVMSTYCAAQGLLVWAVRERVALARIAPDGVEAGPDHAAAAA